MTDEKVEWIGLTLFSMASLSGKLEQQISNLLAETRKDGIADRGILEVMLKDIKHLRTGLSLIMEPDSPR